MVKSIFIQMKAQEQLLLRAVIILVPAKLQCLPDTSDELFPTPVGLISHVHLESNTQEIIWIGARPFRKTWEMIILTVTFKTEEQIPSRPVEPVAYGFPSSCWASWARFTS